MELKNFRHGDMALIGVEKLPDGLTASTSKVLMKGSGGNDHAFTAGTFYPNEDGQTVGYFVAVEGTRLVHPDHGQIVEGQALRQAEIPAGVYEVRRQVEQTHDAMRFVED